MARLTAGLLCTTASVSVQAQEWRFATFDDGSFFSAAISLSPGPGFAVLCGERSPQGLTAAQTGNMEPDITPRDAFRLYFDPETIGVPQGMESARRDVLVVIGSTGHRLPPIRWNELFATWEVDLPATDPVFAAISGPDSFELRSDAGSRRVSATGFGPALAQLTRHCQTMFTSIGLPWHSVAAPLPRQVPMREIAEAAVQSGCGGPAIIGPKAYLSGDIDGDGQTDVVVDWSEITCSGGYPRPFCGASMCSAQLFVSALFPRRGQPEDLLALGVELQPLSNGRMGVATAGSMVECQARGRQPCRFVWYWNGADIVRLD
ncbi:hypothetical protein ACFMPD_05890 [Sedimentitalea sp. HM32M-2]|uniref:hypothetical protein n=1 Tax=Sedimentitalea sp. HM32M-2 TaxID=3351566 RepID=UPI0036305DDC